MTIMNLTEQELKAIEKDAFESPEYDEQYDVLSTFTKGYVEGIKAERQKAKKLLEFINDISKYNLNKSLGEIYHLSINTRRKAQQILAEYNKNS